jgi:hypothetical protein
MTPSSRRSTVPNAPTSLTLLTLSWCAGALQYLTFTTPDIHVVQQVCLHMDDPQEPHITIMKRILDYLQSTLDHCLLCHTSTFDLVVCTNADWAGCPDPRRFTSSYVVFLGDNLVS